jgi:tetratricopeptide (TPR) repeat protein
MNRTPHWTAFLAGLALACSPLACSPGEAEVPAPPRPPNMAEFDPRVVKRIEDALGKVGADPRRAQPWADLGMVYASERLRNLAIDCFHEAARLEPKQPKWPYREAVTQGQLGEFDKAIEALQRSVAIEPTYPPSHARLGGFRLSLGDLDGAERDFRKATELDSNYPGGWVGLARVALQRDQNAQAIEILERLSKGDPDDATFRQLLACARVQEGAGSGLSAEKFLSENEVPVWNDPWELEARAFREQPSMIEVGRLLERGKTDERSRCSRSARAGRRRRRRDPCGSPASPAPGAHRRGAQGESSRRSRSSPEQHGLVMKAQILDASGEVPAAVALLDRVTQLQPTFGGAFAAKGKKLFRLGQHEKAVVALQRAIELGEDDVELRHALARSLIVLKRWSESRALLEKLAVEEEDDANAWLELATTQLHTGALDEAEKSLARGREAGGANAQLLADVERAQEQARERRAKAKAKNGEGKQK